MEILGWVNVLLVSALLIACVGLYFDARGERSARRALEEAMAARFMAHEILLAAHDGRLGAHDRALTELGGAVGALRAACVPRRHATPLQAARTEPPVDATSDHHVQLPRIDVETEDERETPPDTPRAAAPQDGEGGEIAFLPLGEDTLAGIDVLVAHWRVTREEAIGWCLRTGAELVEQHGPGSGEHYESREELTARLVEVGLQHHLSALPALAAQHAARVAAKHDAAPEAKSREHDEEITRPSRREPRRRRWALVGIPRARLAGIAWRTTTLTKPSAGTPLPRVGDVVALRAVVLGIEPDGVILEVPDVIEPRRVLVPLALIAGPWVPRG